MLATRIAAQRLGRTDSSGRPAGQSGWTIIEMAIVVTIFSLMLAIGMPFMTSMLANAKVRSAVESLQDGLGVAQAEALRRSTNTEFLLVAGEPVASNVTASAASSGTNWLVRVPVDATRGLAAVEFVRGSSSSEPTAAPALENRSGAIGVAFSSSGRVLTSTAGVLAPSTGPLAFRVTANNADRPLCVYVTIAGSIKSCDPKLASGDFRACLPALPAASCPST